MQNYHHSQCFHCTIYYYSKTMDIGHRIAVRNLRELLGLIPSESEDGEV